VNAPAQITGEWLSAEIEFDLPKKFTAEASLEGRFLNPGGMELVKYFGQAGLSYKISRHFDVTFKYRYSMRVEDNMHYYPRHRLMFDFKADYPLKRFKFDYRARFQRISKTYIEDELDLIDFMHWRNRFRASYNVRNNPIEPSVYIEFFSPLNALKQEPVDEIRYGADVSYPITKKQSISGGIILIHEQFETGLSGIIFELGYKIRVL
jgi:hypothetical protein